MASVTNMKHGVLTGLRLFVALLLVLVIGATFFSLFTDPKYMQHQLHKRGLSPNQEQIDRIPRLGYTSTAPKAQHVTKVIIASYMRSGTTFTGRLFEMNEDALYIFEPLWYLCIRAVPAYKPLKYLNGTRRPSPPSCRGLGLEETGHYLACHMDRINLGSLTQVWMKLSQKTNHFNICGVSPACVQKFTTECKMSSVRVIKTIRLSIDELEPLLMKQPDLKLIHLVRDPRGIIQSRIKMGEYYHRSPLITGAEVCGDILRNTRKLKRIKSHYPGRLLQTRYEDFAADPIAYAKDIYSFLKVAMPDGVKQWVLDNTRASSNDDGPLGTTRANSSLTAYTWRTDIPWDIAIAMDHICSRVYKELGYIPVESEPMLRDLSIPLRHR